MPYVFCYKGKRFFGVAMRGKSAWKFFIQKTLRNACLEIKNRYICKPYNTDNN